MGPHRFLVKIIRDRTGASTIEYGMILAFVVLAMFAALQGLAGETVSMWNTISTRSSVAMAKN